MKVSFASVVTETICTGSALRTWHTSADNDRFLQDAAARAQTVQRSMRYASDKERTYNSATGLTSPAVLPQYLASPAEATGAIRRRSQFGWEIGRASRRTWRGRGRGIVCS